MQNTTNEGLPNSPGLKVIHENGLYYLENEKKQRQFQAYTDRKMADKALHDYLVEMVRTAPANMKKKNVN